MEKQPTSMDPGSKQPTSNDPGSEKTRKVDLDTLLAEELGQFGRQQARTLALCFPLLIFMSWSALEYIFTTGRIPTRCLIPECDGLVPEWSPPWLGVAAPPNDGCARFLGASGNLTAPDPTCPANLFDPNVIVPCEERVYENDYTVVYDFDLGCDEWRRSFIGTYRLFGTFIALPITGWFSDRWGRKTALISSVFNTAWLGVVRYWANSYWGFVISEVIEAILGSAGFTCAYILLMELVGTKYRVATGACISTYFAIGQMLLALVAWAVPNWRQMTLVLYIPQLLTIALYWMTNESVRWLMSRGRYDEAEEVLRKVAKVNRKHLSEETLIALRRTNEEKRMEEEIKQGGVKDPWLLKVVWEHKPVLLRCLVCPILWITSTLVYYGLSLNAVNLSGNRYLNFALVCLVEIPGYWLGFFAMQYGVGRKTVLTTAYWSCAVCITSFILIPNDYFWLLLTMYLVGKLSIATEATLIYVYTTELFPTQYRHRLLAFCSMMGRIGSMIAPLTPALGDTVWEPLPFVMFASLCVASGSVMFLLPETLGAKLPDTMEEADRLGKTPNTPTPQS